MKTGERGLMCGALTFVGMFPILTGASQSVYSVHTGNGFVMRTYHLPWTFL